MLSNILSPAPGLTGSRLRARRDWLWCRERCRHRNCWISLGAFWRRRSFPLPGAYDTGENQGRESEGCQPFEETAPIGRRLDGPFEDARTFGPGEFRPDIVRELAFVAGFSIDCLEPPCDFFLITLRHRLFARPPSNGGFEHAIAPPRPPSPSWAFCTPAYQRHIRPE